jgi:hypothetical protein
MMDGGNPRAADPRARGASVTYPPMMDGGNPRAADPRFFV